MEGVPAPRVPRTKPSQHHIARKLGVSQATVSHVLNGKRHLCGPETYAKVWAAAAAIGYQGRGLTREARPRALELRQVAIVLGAGVTGTCPPALVAHLNWAVEECLAARGIAALPLGTATRLREPLFTTLVREVELALPVIVIGPASPALLARIQALASRVVTLGAPTPAIVPAVPPNHEHAAELLVAHLKALRHARVAWFAELDNAHAHPALAAACVRHRLELAGGTNFVLDRGRATGREAALRFLSRYGQSPARAPTAIVCSSVAVARAAAEEFRVAGLRVPRDLSIAALEASDDRLDQEPIITTAAADPVRMAAVAVDLLLEEDRVRRGSRQVTLPAELQAGNSTDVAPAPRARSLHAA